VPSRAGGFFVALIPLALLCGCGKSYGEKIAQPDQNPGLPATISVAPELLSDGWRTSTPGAEGMEEKPLLELMQSIRDGALADVDSIVIAKNDALIAEGYFHGFGRDTPHDMRSASKSITSALAGIAVSQGLLAVDTPIAQYLPNFDSYKHPDARKNAIEVFHLLNMNSGLDCNDWDDSSPGNEDKMYEKDDWPRFILDLPMAHAPGEASSYCTGGVVVLGSIVATRSGVPLDNYAATWLFNPLGIQDVNWRRQKDGTATGGGGMRLRPRDMAKFGNLFVDGGRWKGVPVIPESWIEPSLRQVTTLNGTGDKYGYGFNWWKGSFQVKGATEVSTFAWGNGGNFIFLFPLHQLVVVITASNYDSAKEDAGFFILKSAILPALQ
jgi:CubicO group peptidase (beta-lactamase class C family)